MAAGGAHMDPFFRAEGLRGFLTGLRQGKTPKESSQLGKDQAAAAIDRWNSRREYQVHRWEHAVDSIVDRVLRKIVQTVKGISGG